MARDRTAASHALSSIQPKLSDPDADIRFMGLSDLSNVLSSPGSEYLKQESHTSGRLIESLLKSLKDGHGEVQNQALKCVGPLARRVPPDYIVPLFDKVIDLTKEPGLDVSIPTSALRTLVCTFPRPQPGVLDKDVREPYQAISKVLIPRLVGYVPSAKSQQQLATAGLLQQQQDKGYNSDAVDVMIEVVQCYGSILTEQELVSMNRAAMNIIESPQANGVVKKRALAAVGAIAIHLDESPLDSFISSLVDSYRKSGASVNVRRFLISTIGTLARSVPITIGRFVGNLIPLVLEPLSQDELEAIQSDDEDRVEADADTEELREAALVSLEAFVVSCPVQTQPHLSSVIMSALRCVKYDPNIAEEDDEEMGGTQDVSDDGLTEEAQDEDDEYGELDDEDAFSDVDDMSWKVRRCAAKTLHTIITANPSKGHESLFGQVAPVLITRLINEREDSVRLEIISAITSLIRQTAFAQAHSHAVDIANGTTAIPNNRKRRREDSVPGITDKDLRGLVQIRASPPIETASSPSGPGADLAIVVPKIVQAVTNLWKKASISLKQGTIIMLKAIATGRNGALADHLQQLEDPVADALKPSPAGPSSSAAGSSATVASLQIETLSLISAITETNGNQVLIPFVIALIPSVTSISNSRNYKVIVEALATIEQFIKALTPPRLQHANQDHAIHIQTLHDVVIGPVSDMNTDLEIRHRAIQVLGVLIARTSATGLLPQITRLKALGVLNDRLKNETTRLASARAIGLIAEAAKPEDNIGSEWIHEVSLELANQLRKVDRALRGSCLETLQYLALNPTTAAQYDTRTIEQLQALLMPLLTSDDLHMLTPSLVILSRFIPTNAAGLVTDDVVKALCLLTRTRLEGLPLRAYLLVVKVIGEQNAGNNLMRGLLAIGVDGDTMVLGRAIGTLIVYSGQSIGVSVDDFLKEVDTTSDTRSRCLALAVLGEVGMRMGPSSPLGLDVFVRNLSAESEKVRLSAAMALGSASSSNMSQSMPIILTSFGKSPSQDYLYLHALKEILQHSESAAGDIAPYTPDLWKHLFAAADVEDNLAVGSECLGRLVVIEPTSHVPELLKSLDSPSAAVRGTVVAAFRFTLSDTSQSYDNILSKVIISSLTRMLTDTDIGNRRLAITTLNAAIHNKPDLIIPQIGQLFSIVLADSVIKPELIKKVRIGPFTHEEDSGLDLRKATYSTMYALLDSPRAITQLPIPAIFARIVDGIADDHDIRTLCNLMIQRLITIDPAECRRNLSPLADKFKAVLSRVPKESAVKQEIEKFNEANSSVIRISLELEAAFPTAGTTADATADVTAWKTYMEWINKDFANIVRAITSEK